MKQNFNLKMHQTSIWRDQLFLISQLKLTKFDKLCTGIFIFELAPFKQLIFIQMLCHLAQCLKRCIFNGCCKCYLLAFASLLITCKLGTRGGIVFHITCSAFTDVVFVVLMMNKSIMKFSLHISGG